MGYVRPYMRDLRSWTWQSQSHLSRNQAILCCWWSRWNRGESNPVVFGRVQPHIQGYCGFDHYSLSVDQGKSANCIALRNILRRKHGSHRFTVIKGLARKAVGFRSPKAATNAAAAAAAQRTHGNDLRSAAALWQQDQKRGGTTWFDGGAAFHLADNELQDENGWAARSNQRSSDGRIEL